jgi:hypothetical protein
VGGGGQRCCMLETRLYKAVARLAQGQLRDVSLELVGLGMARPAGRPAPARRPRHAPTPPRTHTLRALCPLCPQWWWTTANSCQVPGAPTYVGSDNMAWCNTKGANPEEVRSPAVPTVFLNPFLLLSFNVCVGRVGCCSGGGGWADLKGGRRCCICAAPPPPLPTPLHRSPLPHCSPAPFSHSAFLFSPSSPPPPAVLQLRRHTHHSAAARLPLPPARSPPPALAAAAAEPVAQAALAEPAPAQAPVTQPAAPQALAAAAAEPVAQAPFATPAPAQAPITQPVAPQALAAAAAEPLAGFAAASAAAPLAAAPSVAAQPPGAAVAVLQRDQRRRLLRRQALRRSLLRKPAGRLCLLVPLPPQPPAPGHRGGLRRGPGFRREPTAPPARRWPPRQLLAGCPPRAAAGDAGRPAHLCPLPSTSRAAPPAPVCAPPAVYEVFTHS